MKNKNITGIILAGGKNSRMGSDKGLLKVGNKKFIEFIVEELSNVVDEILIVSNGNNYSGLGLKVYRDIFKDCGPMGGIHTALTSSKTDKNLILGCDMPFISRDILGMIVDQSSEYEIAIPEHDDGVLEPLCAVYSKSCLARYTDLLEQGKWRLIDSLKIFNVRKITIAKTEQSEHFFMNINTPDEYLNIKNSKFPFKDKP